MRRIVAMHEADGLINAMKPRDTLVLMAASAVGLALIFTIAGEEPATDLCLRIRAGLVIGGSVLFAIWGYTRLGARQ